MQTSALAHPPAGQPTLSIVSEPAYKMQHNRLEVYRALSFDEYAEAVGIADDMKSMACWLMADLMVYGERYMPDTYLQAFEDDDHALKTFINYRPVALAFPPNERTHDLAFSCYQVVVDKQLTHEQRHDLLTEAAQQPVNKRGWLRQRKAEIKGATPRLEPLSEYHTVSTDGTLTLVDLPVHLRGQRVVVKVSLDREAA